MEKDIVILNEPPHKILNTGKCKYYYTVTTPTVLLVVHSKITYSTSYFGNVLHVLMVDFGKTFIIFQILRVCRVSLVLIVTERVSNNLKCVVICKQ